MAEALEGSTDPRRSETIGRIPLPREHGAWVMGSTSVLLGLLLAPTWHAAGVALAGAFLLGFLARAPLALCARGRRLDPGGQAWAVATCSGALVAAGVALLLVPADCRGALLALLAALGLSAALDLHLVRRRQERSLGGEVLGALGMAALAPALVHAGGGSSLQAGRLGVLLGLFMVGAVLRVRSRTRARSGESGPLSVYQGFAWGLWALLLAGLVAGLWRTPLVLAYATTLLAALWALATGWAAPARARSSGWLEVAHLLWFCLWLVQS